MGNILDALNRFIWGIPVLLLILFIGVFYSIRTRLLQIRLFPLACRKFIDSLKHTRKDGISGYRALCTALAATVGTGNIVGVAGAIAIGGPGVVFWMWISSIIGMLIKFAEIFLAMHYRERGKSGEWIGGTMYIIKNGLPNRFHFLGYLYAFFGVIATLGIGNATQVNAVIGGLQMVSNISGHALDKVMILLIASIIAVVMILTFCRGATGIGIITERLVPVAAIVYITFAVMFLMIRCHEIPSVIKEIIEGAFAPKTATCGLITSFFLTLRVGVSRGIFTNEAGMGTAAIAHCGADNNDPISQGLLGTIEVFIDTIVICTLTALVILCSKVPIPFGTDPGIQLTLEAYTSVFGRWSIYVIVVLVCIFAFATILGWGLYGLRCIQFLFGEKAYAHFYALQILGVFSGALIQPSGVWIFSEIMNGLMAIPNLIALYLLHPMVLSNLKNMKNSVQLKTVRYPINSK